MLCALRPFPMAGIRLVDHKIWSKTSGRRLVVFLASGEVTPPEPDRPPSKRLVTLGGHRACRVPRRGPLLGVHFHQVIHARKVLQLHILPAYLVPLPQPGGEFPGPRPQAERDRPWRPVGFSGLHRLVGRDKSRPVFGTVALHRPEVELREIIKVGCLASIQAPRSFKRSPSSYLTSQAHHLVRGDSFFREPMFQRASHRSPRR